jgi:hypothetical protein
MSPHINRIDAAIVRVAAVSTIDVTPYHRIGAAIVRVAAASTIDVTRYRSY